VYGIRNAMQKMGGFIERARRGRLRCFTSTELGWNATIREIHHGYTTQLELSYDI
jgi:hypothetical protein